MKTWAVSFLIHVRTPYQHIPQLVISKVPDNERPTIDLLERAGYQFGEFGIPWANHELVQVDKKNSASDLIWNIRDGVGERITWDELQNKANAPLLGED